MKQLEPYRQRIDAIDDEIIRLLGERTQIVREVGAFKAQHGINVVQPGRVEEVLDRVTRMARAADLDDAMIRDFFARLIDRSHKLEAEDAGDRKAAAHE